MLGDNCNDSVQLGAGILDKTDGMGVFGTLILYGPTFQALAAFFLDEFRNQPRIGAKNWSDRIGEKPTSEETRARERSHEEKANDLLWTAANRRDFVVVKFGAREIGGARQWIGDMIRRQGSIEKEFGPQALIGLR